MLKTHHRFMLDFTGSFLRSLKRPVFVYLSTLAMTSQLGFALVFYQLERFENPAVKNFFDSLYYTVTVMTGVGLGDIYAVTTAGKIVSMLMMLAGTAIFVCFTGVLAASILSVESDHLSRRRNP